VAYLLRRKRTGSVRRSQDVATTGIIYVATDLEKEFQMTATILVADDEIPIAELLADLLEEVGYRVILAYNGADALHLLEHERPDLLVTDNMMPRLSGMQLIAHIQQHNTLAIPVILMSAVRPEPQPTVPFVPKPFDLNDMLDLVAKLLPA
jgi:CheY-like chemotaxis protein